MEHTIKTPFGEITYSLDDRISLPQGIPGFEDARHAIWVSLEEYEPLKWLVLELDEPVVLPLLDPFILASDYHPDITEGQFNLLETENPEAVAVFCVATPRKEQLPTINLRSPVLINPEKQVAIQVILDDEELPIRYHWEASTLGKAAC